MIPATVFIEASQRNKIRNALRNGKGCSIKICRKPHDHTTTSGLLKGEMLMTSPQWKKYQKTPTHASVTLPFLHNHLKQNMRHKGGIIPLIASLLAPILGGVAGGLIEKEIAGSGLHPPKLIFGKKKTRSPSIAFQIEPAHGNGLYLKPWDGGFKSGTGLYLSPYPHKKFGSGLHKLESGHMFSTHCTQFSSPQKETLKSLVDLL